MSADGRRSSRDSSADHQVSSNDVLFCHSRQGRVFNGGDSIGFEPPLMCAQPSGNPVVAPVNVTEYFDNFRSFKDAWRFAANH